MILKYLLFLWGNRSGPDQWCAGLTFSSVQGSFLAIFGPCNVLGIELGLACAKPNALTFVTISLDIHCLFKCRAQSVFSLYRGKWLSFSFYISFLYFIKNFKPRFKDVHHRAFLSNAPIPSVSPVFPLPSMLLGFLPSLFPPPFTNI